MGTIGDEKLGSIKIADDVIAVCGMNAALQTEGVASLSKGISESISNMLGKEPAHRGIKVVQSEDGIVIDIFPIVIFGVKIPEVAFQIQRNVKRDVEEMVEAPVKAVNIHVQGVDITQTIQKRG